MAATHSPRWTHNESGKGHTPSAEYRAWHNMKQRVRQGGPWYAHVTIDPRWLSYANFLEDMGRKPTSRHSLDRKKGKLGYTKTNCRWATPSEQSRNLSHNRWLTHGGETLCVAEWAERLGCSAPCIFWRIANGWTVADAVTTRSQRKAA